MINIFKDILKQLRIEKNLTQDDLAKALNVTTGTIGNYELGTRLPKDDKMWIKLSQFFDVPIDYLMDSDNSFLSYGGSDSSKKNELIKKISNSDLTDLQIELLINMIDNFK